MDKTPTTPVHREAWLARAVDMLRPAIRERAGLEVPPLRIGAADCGAKIAGVAYQRAAVSDGLAEVTVSFRHRADQPWRIVGTIAHELIHAAGIRGHRRDFSQAARAVGLRGKPTKAGLDCELEDVPPHLRAIVDALGAFPAGHVALAAPAEDRPKQASRMLRGECPACGLVLRMSRTWIERATAHAPARCPDIACAGRLTFAG